MLFEAIQFGSLVYHRLESYGKFYDDYLSNRNGRLWQDERKLNMSEIKLLIQFLNQWGTHYRSTPEQLLGALVEAFPLLNCLKGRDFVDLDFEAKVEPHFSVAQAIASVFDTIARCGPRYESTGTGKILHTINPQLFVMWDSNIAHGYGLGSGNNDDCAGRYANRFLPRMQRLLRHALKERTQQTGESREQVLRALCECGHTLPKVLDEFNYVKFTLQIDEVWDLEFDTREDGISI